MTAHAAAVEVVADLYGWLLELDDEPAPLEAYVASDAPEVLALLAEAVALRARRDVDAGVRT